MQQASDMSGKAALVTGAASGLGRGTAIALAKAGANVCVVDLNEDGLKETAAAIAELGVECLVRPADLSKKENCDAVVAESVEKFGRLDALCNVAGVIFFNHSTDMTQVQWDTTMAVNLSAPFFLSQAAIPHLLEQNGAIVNVTSSASFMGEAYAAAYCATKAGLTNLTKAMAMEYMHKPIRINAVAPGGMVTNIVSSFMNMPQDLDHSLMARFKPLRGTVEVEDVANAVAFMASDAARGYHGNCISIDNGITAG
ncbi:SDR family NAD(P)-dependent oxidoreductase [Pseudomaricurvus sp. HS19]|uniref:SDR family NAD(P)-dependent oxidoreductase n=1 Tax=Pseudomaricurvus sp. HS19 TaxID=2692626 RepID=UPI00136A4CDC|nr:SDR family oxidoreductase [Pseudomaricurvus sp. HS19]MYM61884.1 SDR family oxidoreductase [Pseudomaricurvus sp. HS19]